MTVTAMSIALRAELLNNLRDPEAGTGFILDNDSLTEFCEAFGDTIPASVMAGRWEDIQGQIGQGLKKAALTQEEYRSTPFQMQFFKHNEDNDLSFVYQMRHTWQVGTDVNPHLHYVPMSAPAAPEDIHFSYTYVWRHVDEVIPDIGSWTSGTKTVEVVAADEFVHKVTVFGPITPPAAAKESSALLFYVTRLGTDPLDTYTTGKATGTAFANLGLISSDCHIQRLATGTVEEFPV